LNNIELKNTDQLYSNSIFKRMH